MERADWATVARLAGVSLLFAGWVAVLVARSNAMSRDGVGASLFLIGIGMLALHVALGRLLGRSPDAAICALLGAAAVPAGLLAVLWTTPAVRASAFDIVEPASVGTALLMSAAVFAATWLLAREPRWLLVIPLAFVAGVELHLTSSSVTEVSGGGGDWPRFVVLLAAVGSLLLLGRAMPEAERRNLAVAASLLVPAAYISVPVADGPSVVRDVVGLAFLTCLAWIAWRRATPGIGFALLLVAGLEVVSLNQHGHSVVPGMLVLLIGASLVAAGTSVFFAARRGRSRSTPLER